jgi:hypothetical protein
MNTTASTRLPARFCGWLKPAGGDGWTKLAEGFTREECLSVLIELGQAGELLILDAGQLPQPGAKGQVMRGR